MSNRLASHISHTLQYHACAVVPGLGGFVLETLPAYYDATQYLAFPPSVSLHFNEELTHQDGMLDSRYASVYGVSLRRGRLMLEEDVRQLRQTLIQQGEVSLSGLGLLQLGQGGRISFVPSLETNLGGASYGLLPTTIPTGIPSSVGDVESEEERDPRYLYLRLSKRWVGAAAVVSTLIFSLIPFGKIAQTEKNYTAGFVPNELSAVRLFGQEATEVQEPIPAPMAQPTSAPGTLAVQHQSPAQPSPEQTNRYYIVVGSERQMERAELFMGQIKDELPQARVLSAGKMYRIVVQDFATSADAYQGLNQFIKEHPKHKTAWVFCPKNK